MRIVTFDNLLLGDTFICMADGIVYEGRKITPFDPCALRHHPLVPLVPEANALLIPKDKAIRGSTGHVAIIPSHKKVFRAA